MKMSASLLVLWTLVVVLGANGSQGKMCYSECTDAGIVQVCGGSESDKSQERTDLLSEGTGLIFRAGKLWPVDRPCGGMLAVTCPYPPLRGEGECEVHG